MNNLSHEQALLATLQGQVIAQGVCISALLVSMPEAQRAAYASAMEELSEHARALYLGVMVPEALLQSFETQLQTMRVPAPSP